ncbi:MAG TPA: sulfite exporter TauE/SafE family protein [Bacteroidaceae bacterium]|nr:sulfite exporter TauE/SafE family protein [Bacteroidaceae bacterium]
MTVFCAFIIGLNKSGLKGLSMITIPLLAHAYGGMTSVAILLPFLIVGDAYALCCYGKSIQFKHIIQLFPWALLGILIATFTGKHIDDTTFRRIIGIVILLCMVGMLYREYSQKSNIPHHPIVIKLFGLIGGFGTMIGNAAGPIFNLYILGMRLPKISFIATGATFYITMNIIKFPIQLLYWKSITPDTMQLNAVCLPALLIGAILGKRLTSYIPEKPFSAFVMVMTLLSAIFMIW